MIEWIIEILDDLVEVWIIVVRLIVLFGLAVTIPIWIIPYEIYKYIENKRDYELFSHHDDEEEGV